MGGVWHWWKSGDRGCLFVIIFWYAFAVAIVFWWLSLSVQPYSIWGAFFVGACIPYARRIWEHETTQDTLYFFKRTWCLCVDMAERFEVWNRARRERTSSNENPTGKKTHHHDEAMRQEQERREAEARARREKSEQARKNGAPSYEGAHDPRSPEDILGLKRPWTQEDLKTAYKREAGRTHPDKWIGKPQAIRQLMEAEYKVIQEAYRILKTSY